MSEDARRTDEAEEAHTSTDDTDKDVPEAPGGELDPEGSSDDPASETEPEASPAEDSNDDSAPASNEGDVDTTVDDSSDDSAPVLSEEDINVAAGVDVEAEETSSADAPTVAEDDEGADDHDEPENDKRPSNVHTSLIKVKSAIIAHRVKILVGAVVVAVAVAGVVIGIPAYHFIRGDMALAEGDYKQAVEEYEQADWFGPVEERIATAANERLGAKDYETASYLFSHSAASDAKKYVAYCDGMAALLRGDYAQAVENLSKAGAVEDAEGKLKEAAFLYGQQLSEDGNYEGAIEQFNTADDYEGAAAALQAANYKRGKQLMDEGSYESARRYFKAAGDYKDAAAWVTTCDQIPDLLSAEDDFDEGNLAAAQAAFNALPRELTWDGVNVGQRQDTLASHQAFVDICGSYDISSGECEVRQTHDSTGIWSNWTSDLSGMGYDADIRCVINDDGSVTVRGSAEFYRYTSFSTVSEYVDGTPDTANFSVTVSSLPNGTTVEDYTTITCSGNTLHLHYSRTEPNEDIYFTYLYRADVTYTKASSY